MLRIYLVHAYGEPDIETANLDWTVTAESVEQAVSLWREYLIKNEWLTAEDAANKQPLNVSLVPPVGDTPMVHEWSDLSVWERAGREHDTTPTTRLRISSTLLMAKGYSRQEVMEGLEDASKFIAGLPPTLR